MLGSSPLAAAPVEPTAAKVAEIKAKLLQMPNLPFKFPEAPPVDVESKLKAQFGRELTLEETTVARAMATHPFFMELTPDQEAKRQELRAKASKSINEIGQARREKALALFAEPPAAALSDKEYRSFPVTSVLDVSPNTKLIKFKLPTPNTPLGLPVASCLTTRAVIDGKDEVRQYTPISTEDTLGEFDLLIKSYPDGKMSKHITSLKVGDSLDFKGPFPKFPYEANSKKAIGMVAGGTGITPMLQVIKKVLANPRDKTELRLIFANETEADILLKAELDGLAQLYPNFKVYYTLTNPPAGWTGFTGYVNKTTLASVLPPPSDEHIILVCGPDGMLSAVSGPKTKDRKQGELGGLLKDMGFTAEQVYKF